MLPREYGSQVCSAARALEVAGERWTLLLLREVSLGRTRFDDLQRALGITRTVLSNRLKHLVDHGVLERRRYQERPPRDEHVLTRKGEDLLVVLLALARWGDAYYPEPAGAPVLFEHEGCGGAVEVEIRCTRCGEHLHDNHEVVRRLGPGLAAAAADGRIDPAAAPPGLRMPDAA